MTRSFFSTSIEPEFQSITQELIIQDPIDVPKEQKTVANKSENNAKKSIGKNSVAESAINSSLESYQQYIQITKKMDHSE